MRITYLHQYFNTPAMAGGTRSYEMARRLVAKGHDVNMITAWCQEDDTEEWFETEEAGIKVYWMPVPYSNNMTFAQRIRAFLRFAWGASRKAASLPADVIFATSTPLTIVLPGVFASRRHKAPMVFEIRDLWPDVPIAMGRLNSRLLVYAARQLEAFAYRHSTYVVALTPTMRDFVSGKRVPLDRIRVVPNGCDLDCADGRPSPERSNPNLTGELPENQRVLLYCGSLGPAHGPDYLVRLAEQFLEQSLNVRIIVVGDGSMRDSLERQASASRCLDRTIFFMGSVAREDVPQYYSKADASVMTMANFELLYRHSVQNKFFDTLAAGRPVFSNYTGWASELAEQSGAGVIVPRDDVEVAARTIASRLQDQKWLMRAGRAASQLAEERFGRDRVADQLEDVLISATAEG